MVASRILSLTIGTACLSSSFVVEASDAPAWPDRALCYVMNEAVGTLASSPLEIPAMGETNDCTFDWTSKPAEVSLEGAKVDSCSWTGSGASFQIEGLQASGVTGTGTGWTQGEGPHCESWTVGWTLSLQTAAKIELALSAPCQPQVSLPGYHQDVQLEKNPFADKEMSNNVDMHVSLAMEKKITEQLSLQPAQKLCTVLSACQQGIKQCGADAEQNYKTCASAAHPDLEACEREATKTLTESCGAIAKSCGADTASVVSLFV